MHCKERTSSGFSPISPQLKTRPQLWTLAITKYNKIVAANKPVTAYFISGHINTMVMIKIDHNYKFYLQRQENHLLILCACSYWWCEFALGV